MTKRWSESEWYVPADWLFHICLALIVPLSAMIAAVLVVAVQSTTLGNPALLYMAGVLGITGIVLLFFAKLPLYRQGVFLAFGPNQLKAGRRKPYWIAYAFIASSILTVLGLIMLLQ